MGSRRTQTRRREWLLANGVTEDALAALHAPIGLDIGADQPAEIAVSILAEIIGTRSGRLGERIRNGGVDRGAGRGNPSRVGPWRGVLPRRLTGTSWDDLAPARGVRPAQISPRPLTASRSSASSATEASILPREKSSMSRPWTISQEPFVEVTGKPEIRPSGTP